MSVDGSHAEQESRARVRLGGIVFVIVAVVLFGLRTDSGALDWVSIITAVAGFVMAIAGLYVSFRGGTRGAGLGHNMGS